MIVPTFMRVFASVRKASVPFDVDALERRVADDVIRDRHAAGNRGRHRPRPVPCRSDQVAGLDQAPLATEVVSGCPQNCGIPCAMPLAGPCTCPWAHTKPGVNASAHPKARTKRTHDNVIEVSSIVVAGVTA